MSFGVARPGRFDHGRSGYLTGMARAIWSGSVSFGLVSIPVQLFSATEDHTVHFNQFQRGTSDRIRYKRVCEKDGEEVSYDHIVKGYEIEKDRYVILDDEDFDKVPVESSRAIDIDRFVDLDDIDPILFKKSYYLIPEQTGAKAYALLREAMHEDGRVGIAKAKELCMTGDAIDAQEALRIGLVDAVFPQSELMDRVKKLAERIAANGPLAVAEVKRLIHAGQSTTLDHAIALEQRSFGLLFATSDQRAGMQAFLAKRKAQFKGQ